MYTVFYQEHLSWKHAILLIIQPAMVLIYFVTVFAGKWS